MRTRLKRGLLSVARRTAELHGAEAPTLPGPFRLPANSSADDLSLEIVQLCNELNSQVSHLCQPSEALDTRWTDGWGEVIRDLSRLRELVLEVG